MRGARPASRAVSVITVVNARTHNLKNVTCAFPVGALTVVTGPSGSGKSSLAFASARRTVRVFCVLPHDLNANG